MKRSGHTLVELLTVITGLAVVLGSATALMQLMMGMNGEVRDRTYALATIGRLADQFRRDAHEASGAPDVAKDKQAIEFHLSRGPIVRWRNDDRGSLVRAELSGKTIQRQSSYALPKETTAAIELQEQNGAQIAILRIHSLNAAGPSLAIEALAGRDARPGEEEKK